MSRSYKKYPVVVQEKDDMRQWNRSLRHNKLAEIPNGSAYKKNIHRSGIWKYRWTEEDARMFYRKVCDYKYSHAHHFADEEDYINWYKKEILRK
jgi:hypothetical protein